MACDSKIWLKQINITDCFANAIGENHYKERYTSARRGHIRIQHMLKQIVHEIFKYNARYRWLYQTRF